MNVQTTDIIDNFTFTELEAKVTEASAPGYTTKWTFDEVKTRTENADPEMVFKPEGPFKSDVTNLKVELDPTFFEINKKYNFQLEVIKSNQGENVIVKFDWTLTMNQNPKSLKLSRRSVVDNSSCRLQKADKLHF